MDRRDSFRVRGRAHLKGNSEPGQLVTGLRTIAQNTSGGITSPLAYRNGGSQNPRDCSLVVQPGWKPLGGVQRGQSTLLTTDQNKAIYELLPEPHLTVQATALPWPAAVRSREMAGRVESRAG